MFLNFSQAHLRRRVVSRQPRTITLLPLQGITLAGKYG